MSQTNSAPIAWEQIANLNIRLRAHLEFCRQNYRGQNWYLLADKLSNSHFRCNEDTHHFLGLLDGERTLQQAYEESTAESGKNGLDQESILHLLIGLAQADLLQGDLLQNDEQRAQRSNRHQQQQGRQRLLKPFAIRIPLLDPDQFLEKLLPLAKLLFTRTALWLWIALLAFIGINSLSLWPEIQAHWDTRFLDTSNLLWFWLLYPVVKGLHELGHGLATKYWGGEVHEMGIMLLVFMPLPYVDASASTTFYSKHRRMVVGAMGVMVELFLSAIALWIWQSLDTGLGKDIAFNIAVIGGLSTLLFNGNPLLRFDGYYVLTDWIEIPNLGSRSNQYLGYLIKRYLYDMSDSISPVQAPGERGWFVGYGILSGIYRLFISFSIALYVAGKFFVIGVFLACWALFSQIIMPLISTLLKLLPQAQQQLRQKRVLSVIGGFSLLIFVALFLVPFTHSSYTKGIIMLPEQAYLRAKSDGFVQRIAVQDGHSVQAGQLLIQLENNELQVKLETNSAKRMEIQARHSNALNEDLLAAGMHKDELKALEAEHQELQVQLESLQLSSSTQGRLTIPQATDLPGRFVNKGQVLGYVLDNSQVSTRVVVEQQNVDLVRRHTERIEIRLASDPSNIIRASGIREVPSATNLLPSRMLGSQAGGPIAVDAREQEGTKAINKIFQFEISLPKAETMSYLGQSVAVRFVHQRETLGAGWYRQIRELFLNKFQV